MMLVTIDYLPGWRDLVSVGMVVASVPYYGATYAEGIKDLRGDTVPDPSIVLERRRAEAITRLVHLANARAADAVIGIRFHHRDITNGYKELCVYGTAVRTITREQPH